MNPSDLAERLCHTPLFAGLSAADLERLAGLGSAIRLEPGDFLIREGELADAMYLVLDGELAVTKRSGSSEIPLDRVGPGSLQGEIAMLEGSRRLASVRATSPVEVFGLPRDAFLELLRSSPSVSFAIIATAVGRLRSMEGTLREREKLAGLGTLAAGLAHELNNPAAAAVRTVAALEDSLMRADLLLASDRVQESSTARRLTGLERADLIDALSELLDDPEAAGALADQGWSVAEVAAVPEAERPRLAASAEVRQLLADLEMSVGRISEVVTAVKGYAYLDQAPIQHADVRQGLEQTLVIMRHKLGDIRVERDLDRDVPAIEIRGSELNQVWTNLVDNAIDALDGHSGERQVTVSAAPDPDGDGVVVSICDTGPGIPDDIRGRLFEPFFTTKGPGHGTGLGLHIVDSVVRRHGGRIDVESAPGRTCFAVSLPAVLPKPAGDDGAGEQGGAAGDDGAGQQGGAP